MNIQDIKSNLPERGTKNDYFNMKEIGEYRIRIVSFFEMYVKAPFRDKEAKTAYACYVLDRRDGLIKIAELPLSVLRQLAALQEDADYGFASEEPILPYDIKINKTKTGPEVQNVSYNVLPLPAAPLTQEEIDRVNSMESIKEVAMRMHKFNQKKMLEMGFTPAPNQTTDAAITSGRVIEPGDADYVSPGGIPF